MTDTKAPERDGLDEVIERNGGHVVLSNMDTLFDALTRKTTADDWKFDNDDVSLDDAIEHNGGHVVLSNTDTLFDALR